MPLFALVRQEFADGILPWKPVWKLGGKLIIGDQLTLARLEIGSEDSHAIAYRNPPSCSKNQLDVSTRNPHQSALVHVL
ncbi:MAG: hypothetical protein HYT87_19630 [Nitrospirae bacterium]|nr:hypothetical protein [Nitrospirota bacterium]